ncbi:MAG TPA: trypsin-like peptidase domain-containing protein [Miltoncostaea sp.]|nr:trypsin-like peptidase domain-containing protein [Miltoncostaea sp.]
MSTSLPPLTQPHDRGRGPSSGPGGDGPRPARNWPGRRSLAVLMAGTALLGGGAAAGILAATGQLDDGGTTTTVIQRPATVPTAATTATADGIDAAAVYATASPGVVNITSEGVSTGSSSSDPFGQGQPQQGTATGSGFVVDGDGTIVTAAHVVDGASKITIRFSDGSTRVATLQGKDDATDVAVLKVDPSGLTLHPLQLGSSASLKVGDALAAIGSPFGYASSLSTGIVSGLDRTIEAPNGFTVAHAIQTDAALNPGNSGGPILDAEGRVIGVADQIATGGSEQSAGVGFAVPIDLVSDEIGQLAAGKAVAHAYLGVSTGDTTGTAGAAVGAVTEGGPAARAGLKAGDVVTAIDGKPITGSADLVAAIAAKAPGDQITLTVRRGGDTTTITATLGTQPAQRSTTGP